MIPNNLDDAIGLPDHPGLVDWPAPGQGIEVPSSESYGSITWSVAPSLQEDTTPSTWSVSIVSRMDAIHKQTNTGTEARHVYANGMRIARIDCTGNPPTCATSYYLGDHLGSTRKVLDATRTTIFSAQYEPFGKLFSVTGTEGYKFTSERHDDPSGLVYLRARLYDPEVGRFASADPVLGTAAGPQTPNRRCKGVL